MSIAYVKIMLVSLNGDDELNERTLQVSSERPILIGRSSKSQSKNMAPTSANAYLDSPVISRRHAILRCSSHWALYLKDEKSTHGTSINGSNLAKDEESRVHDGDVIKFGIDIVNGSKTHKACVFRLMVVERTSKVVKPMIGFTVPESESSAGEEISRDHPTSNPISASYSDNFLDPSEAESSEGSTNHSVDESEEEPSYNLASIFHQPIVVDEFLSVEAALKPLTLPPKHEVLVEDYAAEPEQSEDLFCSNHEDDGSSKSTSQADSEQMCGSDDSQNPPSSPKLAPLEEARQNDPMEYLKMAVLGTLPPLASVVDNSITEETFVSPTLIDIDIEVPEAEVEACQPFARGKSGISIADILDGTTAIKQPAGTTTIPQIRQAPKRKAEEMSESSSMPEAISEDVARTSETVADAESRSSNELPVRPKRIKLQLAASALAGALLGGAGVLATLINLPEDIFQ